jgi:hypothetical protein
MEAYVWRLWKQSVNPNQIMKDWSMLSWAAKWLFDSKVYGDVVGPKDANRREDAKLCKELWELMEEADIVITHNGNRFDLPRIRTRFLMNGLPPYREPRSIDTLAVLKRSFQFTSNKLDLVNEQLNILQKLDHEGFDMWKKACNGEYTDAMSALTTMLAYNKQDVLALEDLYMVLRPWIKSHPNINLYQDWDAEDSNTKCAHCGSSDISWDGKYYTPAGRFMSFRCDSCGAIGRSRYSDLCTDERKALGMSVAN